MVATCGSHVVAAAAKHHSTPVVVLSPLHTLSPLYPYDTNVFNLCVSPQSLCPFTEGFAFNLGDLIRKVDLPNPTFDYIPPDLITLFLTNIGPHPPSYIQRLVAEHHE